MIIQCILALESLGADVALIFQVGILSRHTPVLLGHLTMHTQSLPVWETSLTGLTERKRGIRRRTEVTYSLFINGS